LNLHHRGAAGADEVTGDGAGILASIPDEFFKKAVSKLGIKLPKLGEYGVGHIFLPKDKGLAEKTGNVLERAIEYYGMKVLGWRDVPVKRDCLGELALQAEPGIKQILVDGNGDTGNTLETKLYLARRRAEKIAKSEFGQESEDFYVTSLSSRTVCYKGMFMAWQLFEYYPDLSEENFASPSAIVHQRYSTNTLPNWRLAQPFRCVAHNGEINTLSGNRNHMFARYDSMESDVFGEHIEDIIPVMDDTASDSACFDNVLELLVRAGREIPHSIMMMIPEAFGPKYHISEDKRAFYEFHSSIMEPWDGPAAMIFTDGKTVGGTLDRNGLRPCRYTVTNDGLAVLASETGVIEFPADKVRMKGRLQPGKMFVVDTEQGRIISDNEVKSRISRQKPYRRWLSRNRIELRGLFGVPDLPLSDPTTLTRRLAEFGYTREELKRLLIPMAVNGQEPVGSMGNDAPLAVLSDRPRLVFDYFKQLFAQVTNPPIDPLREGLVMSLMSFTGRKRNLLSESPQHCNQLKLPHPVLTNEDIEQLRSGSNDKFKVTTVQAVFDTKGGEPGELLREGIDRLVTDAKKAVKNGASLIIISDKEASENKAAIPSLLATSAVYHGLLDKGLQGRAGIVVESGEPREVMHFCLLCGYGANAVNPYLVFESLEYLQRDGKLGDAKSIEIADNYIAAVKKGILKTMSKMGISTLRSYHSAQLFEAIGLNSEVIDKYFTGTTSRIEGIGLESFAESVLRCHRKAYSGKIPNFTELEFGGDYCYRKNGERHLWTPFSVAKLQHAVRNNDQKSYDEFAESINQQAENHCTLRGLFDFRETESVPLDEVEPAAEIVKRFCTGAMSHGSVSKEVHECLAIAMNRLGGMSNTGEGGENADRYTPDANGDSRNCAIKQAASGRFGVTIEYLANAKEIQIKMAQGAKPGEGGQLPGHKVTEEIANMRYSTPGVTLISPPPHHDIYSIEDLAQLIYDLKCSNPQAKVSVKLVSEVGVGTVAAGVAKGNADEVLISGYDGGTGASPMSSIKHAGCPWELGLAETQQVLVRNGLRDRIRVQTDGQIRTGRDVAVAALLGAEQFGFGTSALVTLGCTLLRKCHEGACVFGIATQDPELRKRFAGKPEHLERYMLFVAEELRKIMAKLGFRKLDDMVGRVDLLQMGKAVETWKSRGLDFSSIFYELKGYNHQQMHLTQSQPIKINDNLDWKILDEIKSDIDDKKPTELQLPVKNVNRTVGTILSNYIVKKYGMDGLEDDTVRLTFEGSAGQSFGAFLVKGVTLKLIGESNDYVGKGLSGGKIIIQNPPDSHFAAHENIIIGNTVLYGATRGELYVNGMAGERFAVRNSGAKAVVEGVGDHCCEYMTGGAVVVLGQTGCNFAAGMSGGVAYILDELQLFDTLCNLDMVDLENVYKDEDCKLLYEMIEKHYKLTNSERAGNILDTWDDMVGRFVKVMPIDYRKALERIRQAEQRDTDTTPATEEVF
jgi:glutamate synthase domain-containing protein 2/glutamate synthase domain-containing protein 1/glutamate synthase domain-containing protein 3